LAALHHRHRSMGFCKPVRTVLFHLACRVQLGDTADFKSALRDTDALPASRISRKSNMTVGLTHERGT
jgi:hypothetical protein